jgi:acyl-CoA thioesterase FadM
VILAAGILFGEEFSIRRIKYSHAAFLALILVCMAVIVLELGTPYLRGLHRPSLLPSHDMSFWGYVVPICIGFLIGPWLDLQQWQRAIQMRRENTSITLSYGIGALLFGAILLFHGVLALWAMEGGFVSMIHTGLAGYPYAESLLTRVFSSAGNPWLLGAYLVFLGACILTTLDSGYIALRWFFQSNAAKSKNPIFALIPERLIISPIPTFLLCGIIAVAGAAIGIELEYFMIFFATFFVGYSVLSIGRAFMNGPVNVIPQVKMFCVGSLAVVIFAYGYFLHQPVFQILGSLLPLGYVLWLIVKPLAGEDFTTGGEELELPPTASVVPLTPVGTVLTAAPAGSHDISGRFEEKWFVHSFVATYADTNSVGNVYFGMYAMWVGKTRELFFNRVMPKFNLKETPFYILTRSFEHKFVRETREFETVSVKIRIAGHNRKFVTLEHEIYDSGGNLLGKGSQSLLFVSSSDYRMLDIPQDVMSAFLAYS